MEIVCEHCNTRHYLSDDRIPLETKTGKCKKCSAPITVLGKNATVSIEPTPIQSTPPEPEATKNCDFCGEKVLAIAKKCRYCGSMLDVSHAANSQAGVKQPEDVTPPHTDNAVDITLVHKTTNNKKISDDNTATRLWNRKTKIIVVVFLLTVPLALTWYIKVYEVVTTTIEYQNDIAYIHNSHEPFTGKYVPSLYSNGQKQIEESFMDGKQEGLTIFWYDNGQKKWEENWKDGKQDGLSTEWHDNGQKKLEENWNDEMRDGLTTAWHDNGQKKFEGKYKDGKKDGLTTFWRENGQKVLEENYKDGKEDGLITFWHENRQKQSESNYKNGKQDGLSTEWYDNGQKQSESNYKNGKEEGLSTFWSENGQKNIEANYKNGKKDGLTTAWYDNGQKAVERNFKDGKEDGLTTFWNDNGQKTSEVNYKDGLPIK